jgi:hypothetical protein
MHDWSRSSVKVCERKRYNRIAAYDITQLGTVESLLQQIEIGLIQTFFMCLCTWVRTRDALTFEDVEKT